MENQFTHGNIIKTLIIFTIPLILSGMFQQIFNWVDAFIVGNVEGELALGGIGATASIYSLFVTIIVGFTSGLSVFAAQLAGKGEKEKLRDILSIFTILLGSVFLIISLLGILFAHKILVILNTPTAIFIMAKEYMQILLIGVPFLAVYNTYSAILRGLGDSHAPFLSVLICSLVNVILDLLFVVIFRFGVVGAAIATMISQMSMALFIVLYTFQKYPLFHNHIHLKITDSSIIKQGFKFSIPSSVQSGMMALGNILLQRFMNGFGEQTVAAITTCYRIDSLIILPILNLSLGISTMVAQNIGANNIIRAKKVLKTGVVMMVMISISLTLFVLIAGESLIKMFGLSLESIEIGKSFFYAISSCYLVYGLAMALRGYLEGTGDMIFSGMGGMITLVIRILLSYACAFQFQNMIIAYAEMLSWIVLFVLYLARFLVKQKKKISS